MLADPSAQAQTGSETLGSRSAFERTVVAQGAGAPAEAPEGEGTALKRPKPRPSHARPAVAPVHRQDPARTDANKAGRGTAQGAADQGKVDASPAAATPAGAPPDVAPSGSLAAAAAAGANPAGLAVSARLAQNGAGACAAAIDAEAAPSMVGVTESNTVSLWSTVEPRDRHAASVFVGQRYGANPAVPFGVTGLMGAPSAAGGCDVTVVQVVASPLPCARVRETLAHGGKALGELAGIQLMQSGDSQTLLMPTATNTCVLVGFRAKFGR